MVHEHLVDSRMSRLFAGAAAAAAAVAATYTAARPTKGEGAEVRPFERMRAEPAKTIEGAEARILSWPSTILKHRWVRVGLSPAAALTQPRQAAALSARGLEIGEEGEGEEGERDGVGGICAGKVHVLSLIHI